MYHVEQIIQLTSMNHWNSDQTKGLLSFHVQYLID